jgi:hypothetical protein
MVALKTASPATASPPVPASFMAMVVQFAGFV